MVDIGGLLKGSLTGQAPGDGGGAPNPKNKGLKGLDWLVNLPDFAEIQQLLGITGGSLDQYFLGSGNKTANKAAAKAYQANPEKYLKLGAGKGTKYLDITKMFQDKPMLQQQAFQKNLETIKSTPAYATIVNESNGQYPTDFKNAITNQFTDTGAKIAGGYAGQGTIKDNIGHVVADVTSQKQDYFYQMQKQAQAQLNGLAGGLMPTTSAAYAGPLTNFFTGQQSQDLAQQQFAEQKKQNAWGNYAALAGLVAAPFTGGLSLGAGAAAGAYSNAPYGGGSSAGWSSPWTPPGTQG